MQPDGINTKWSEKIEVNDLQTMIVELGRQFDEDGGGDKVLMHLAAHQITRESARKLIKRLILNGKLTDKDWEKAEWTA